MDTVPVSLTHKQIVDGLITLIRDLDLPDEQAAILHSALIICWHPGDYKRPGFKLVFNMERDTSDWLYSDGIPD